VNLRSVTLLAAIGQIGAVLVSVANFAKFATRLHWTDNWEYLLSTPFYLFAQIAMAVFLFTLFARQKKG